MRNLFLSLLIIPIMILSLAIYPQTARAADTGQTLELAPQDEGPSLEVTLKFIKDTINSLRGFPNTTYGGLGFDAVVTRTSFDMAPDYTVTIEQEFDVPSYGHFLNHAECDLKTLRSSDKYDNAGMGIHFGSDCKRMDGYIPTPGKTYSRGQYPDGTNYLGMTVIDTGDRKLRIKLNNAFNHLAKLMKEIPKKRSTELFE